MRTGVDLSESAMDIQTSLDKVLDCGTEGFAGRFYHLLFEGFPELNEYFVGVNMQQQAAMLTMALQVIVQHYCKPRRSSKEYLVVLGKRHRDRGVSRVDYEKFEHALLKALAELHENEWYTALAEQWRSAFRHAVDVMLHE